MTVQLTAAHFVERLQVYASPAAAENYLRHFQTGIGGYGEGDHFMGVRMGQVFELAKEFMAMELDEVERLLENPIHEVRVGGVSVMDFQARSKKIATVRKKDLYDLYLRRHDCINNWDLVDRSAPYVVGGYLFDKARTPLYNLARSTNLWERRTAIVSTAYFIRQRDLTDTFQIAELLLHDKHDLIHKATGWMLRAAGGVDRSQLLRFLDQHAATMPRTALRYAIENLTPEERDHYLSKSR